MHISKAQATNVVSRMAKPIEESIKFFHPHCEDIYKNLVLTKPERSIDFLIEGCLNLPIVFKECRSVWLSVSGAHDIQDTANLMRANVLRQEYRSRRRGFDLAPQPTGVLSEPKVLQLYRRSQEMGRVGCKVVTCKHGISPRYPWFCASPDALVLNKHDYPAWGVEIKTTTASTYEDLQFSRHVIGDWRRGFEVDKYSKVYFQMQMCMLVFNVDMWDLVLSYDRNRKIAVFTVVLDHKFLDKNMPLLKRIYFDSVLPFITIKLKKHFFYKDVFLTEEKKMALNLKDRSIFTLHNTLIPQIAAKMTCTGCDSDFCKDKRHPCLFREFQFGAVYPRHFITAALEVTQENHLSTFLTSKEINNVVSNCYHDVIVNWNRRSLKE